MTPGPQDKLVSVVMPCFNASRYLRDSVASVTDQSYDNFELIIVDDGSTDDSSTILRQLAAADPRIKVLTQPNRGAGPARNAALHVATGFYVAFLDADDYWDSDFLRKMVHRIEAAGTELVYCGWQNIGLSGGRGEPYCPPDYAPRLAAESFLRGCPWPIHAAVTHRSVIEGLGGFDERWTSCMDYDLWLKLGARHSISLLPEVLAYYRHHDGEQITKSAARIAENHWRIQKEFLATHPEIAASLGRQRIRALTLGELLHRGYVSYWRRDLPAARKIFRLVMKTGYGTPKDWMYMLPSLLPPAAHRTLIRLLERDA